MKCNVPSPRIYTRKHRYDNEVKTGGRGLENTFKTMRRRQADKAIDFAGFKMGAVYIVICRGKVYYKHKLQVDVPHPKYITQHIIIKASAHAANDSP